MLTYLTRRLIGLIPVFFGITLITFFVIHLSPGKPTDMETAFNPKVSFEAKERLNKLYGLDRPIHEQYLKWTGRILHLDFGSSYTDGRKVSDKVAERIPVTLLINVLSLLIIFAIAVPLGIASATRPHSLFDRSTTILVFIGFATPGFWLALLLISWLGVSWRILPVSGLTSLDYDQFSPVQKVWDVAQHLILPVFVSCFGGLAGISRYMRSSMLEVLGQEYIKMARAKGLKESTVMNRHALRNAILPIVTILGLSVPGLLGGSVIFESIFSIPGMGRLFFDSVYSRDYPTIMGILTIGAILTLLGNLLADIAYFYVDPRIQFQKQR